MSKTTTSTASLTELPVMGAQLERGKYNVWGLTIVQDSQGNYTKIDRREVIAVLWVSGASGNNDYRAERWAFKTGYDTNWKPSETQSSSTNYLKKAMQFEYTGSLDAADATDDNFRQQVLAAGGFESWLKADCNKRSLT